MARQAVLVALVAAAVVTVAVEPQTQAAAGAEPTGQAGEPEAAVLALLFCPCQQQTIPELRQVLLP